MPQPHMGAPQGARYPHWTILLAPATLGQVTKTGKSDDSVFVGDLRHNNWDPRMLENLDEEGGTSSFPKCQPCTV